MQSSQSTDQSTSHDEGAEQAPAALVLSRRRLAQLGGTGLAVALLSACGGTTSAPTGTTAASSTQPASGGSQATAATTATTAASPAASPQASSTQATQAGQPVRGGTLVYARNLDAKTLDPHFSAQFSERFALYCIYNTIVAYDKNFNLVPDLAAKWEVASDGSSVTFTLQPNVKFHDGTACDATAVKWNIDRILNPATNSPLAGQINVIDQTTAPDATTVMLHFKQPNRPLLASLGERPGFVVSPAAVQKYGKDFGANPVGSGPFKFVEWVADSHVTMARFDGYWDTGKPYLDQIEIRHVADPQVQSTMVRTGEAQVIDAVPATLVSVLKQASGVVVSELQSGRFWGTQCHADKPPFNDVNLRMALVYGTDRDEVRTVVFGGTGRVATHPLGSGWAYDSSLDSQFPNYDLAKAKDYLAKANVAGQTFTLTVTNTQPDQTLAQVLQAQYQKLGLTVKIATVDAAQSFAMVKAGTINWTSTDWAPRADPDGLLRILWYSKGFQNTTGANIAGLDTLLDKAAAEYDTSKAAPMYHQAEQLIVNNADYVFMHWPSLFAAMQSSVQNFIYYPDLILRLRDLWLKK